MKRIIVLSLLALLITPSLSYACMFMTTFEEHVEQSDVIFTGKLLNCSKDGDGSLLKYSVHSIWKGNTQKEYMRISESKCSEKWIKASLDKNTIIYANYVKNTSYIKRPNGPCVRYGSLFPSWKRNLYNFISKLTGLNTPRDDIHYLGKPTKIYK